MNKKFFILMLILTLASVSLLSGCGSSGDDGDVIELQFATFWPANDFQVAEGHQAWMDEIEKRTDGRVKFVMQSGEVLLSASEIYGGVADGVADLGTTCPAYTPGLFPVTEAFELPGLLNPNALAASVTVHEGYKALKEEGLMDEYDDVKVLMFWATGPGDVMTTRPVHNLEDMSGMEMRVVGGTVPTMEALGVEPVSLPMSESYLALDSGIVEGILGPNDTLVGFRLAEVLTHITKTPFLYNIVFMKVMNLNTWNSLPSDIQEIIEEVSEEFVINYGKLRADYTNEGLQSGIDQGIEVIELDAAEEAKWRERIEPVVEKWIQGKETSGFPAADIVERVRELDSKYSNEHGDY
ncbi:TRAP transporter substrate-binding protein [Candidatus Contubernalis alkaliaceticus]|uniref:TRAP transporter substrate-binding protein n=1 Tax=Candidatus Contubernalis alkaliaceticus TaxID=338645 RepID=UPI001F4C22A3|nr:TRAP transporter substrate-binding protein [Candidatus Contubernalis alkalaceticus]